MATKIDTAVAWAVAIADDPAHGYDQRNRWGPDYDCSSLIVSAWEAAGVPVRTVYGGTNTWNMISPMLKAGFIEVTAGVDFATGAGLQKGDVIWKKGHVEMMASSTTRVGAHIAENGTVYADEVGDQTGGEISVDPYKNNGWTRVFRFPGGSSESLPIVSKDQIINDNRYLSLAEMYNNAIYIAAYFYSHGWTYEAIAAILGNMQSESNCNPGIWENLEEGNTSGGFGLVQWTPATKLIEWASAQGLDYTDIDAQLARIMWELENGEQYYPTSDYPETFAEFTQSDQTPEYLAAAFLFNYERPETPKPVERGEQARYWYNIISAIDLSWVPTQKRKSLSLLLMWAALRRG